MTNLDYYYDLYSKGMYQEAYTVLLDIIENQCWSIDGDLYVKCANLELIIYDDILKAKEFLDKADELECHFIDIYFSTLGYVLYRTGEHNEGIEYLEKSITLNPSVANLKTYGEILTFSHDKRAIDIWERILEQDTTDLLAHVNLAIESARSGENEKAYSLAQRAEMLASTTYDLFHCGSMYEELNEFQKALYFYNKCEELDYVSKNKLYFAFARCCYDMEDFSKAILYAIKALEFKFDYDDVKDLLLSALELDDSWAKLTNRFIEEHLNTCFAFIILAHTELKKGDFLKVYYYLSQAIQLEPSSVESYHIGHLYAHIGYMEEALKLYKDSEKMDYRDKSILYSSIAGCYLHLKDYISATQYAVKSLYIDPNYDYAKDVLMYCSEKGKVDFSLDTFIEKHSETCLSCILLAQKAFKQKNHINACKMASKAEQLNPSPNEMRCISNLYYDLGDIGKALKKYFKCEELGYDDKCYLYGCIADCYYWLDDFDQSIEYALKVLSMEPDKEFAREIIYACREEVWGKDFGDNY